MSVPSHLQRLPWSPPSWRSKTARQQPDWPSQEHLEAVFDELASLPPLVFPAETRALKQSLAKVAAGQAILLQAGDCAESFRDFSEVSLREKLRILLQMAVVLTYGASLPVVKVGRLAGQYAKPRSSAVERYGDLELPSFRGHMIHDDAPDLVARIPDPDRLLKAYNRSAATLNMLRALTHSGLADLGQVHDWNREFVASSPQGRRYEQLAAEIERALAFMSACGIDVATLAPIHEADVWASHEGLILEYEEALTRREPSSGDWYAGSGHLLWVGDRTRELGGAHVEFLAGLANPVAVKLGPTATPAEVVELCERLDPEREAGKLTLIARLGADRVFEQLPPLLAAVRRAEHPVIWASDPMHGNLAVRGNHKTRLFSDVMAELEGFFAACHQERVWPGGVHLEFTGDDVTECLGGEMEILEEHLATRYESLCDPRLNARQSLDLAFRVADLLRG